MPERQQIDAQPTGLIGAATVSHTPIPGNLSPSVANEVAVKVAVRVRPLNNREKLHQHQPCVRISSETNQIVIGKDKTFTFDYLVPPKTSQAELYDLCVKGLVNSLFEGYNATVFAYGQTGSGKTYTISGNKSGLDEFGIIPRAVHTMFQIINQTQSPAQSMHTHRSNMHNTSIHNKEFCVKVNFIEIYKEELKDLLDTNVSKDLQIREDESGNTIIYGANEIICTTLEEVMACFDTGSLHRHTGSTLMNEQSSRSHSVFTVSIEQRWTDSPNKTRDSSTIYDLNQSESNSYYLGAKFHFVDLAGSERVHRTGNVGDRFKESIHINSGLLALGNVISALSSNDAKRKSVHIPYRDSKITRILKDSLGGNANTLMICCISPSSCNLDESINALKYATRTRYIKNKPMVNMDPHTQRFVEMQSEIQALRDELQRQRTAFINTTGQNNSSHNEDTQDVKQLESKLQNVQSEADHYKKLVKEAFSRFKVLSKNENQVGNRKLVDEWLTMFEACKNKSDFDVEDYAKQKINQLELQLKQALDDLKSDEEIFGDKEKEIVKLKEAIDELEAKLCTANRYLEVSFNKEKEQQELMLQLQIQLDKLMQNNNETNSFKTQSQQQQQQQQFSLHPNGDASSLSRKGANTRGSMPSQNSTKQRAKTAPYSGAENAPNNKDKKSRAVYSSPALFTLERVMQSFRARSQLLAETLEENDNVLQMNLNQTFDVDGENDAIDEEDVGGARLNDEEFVVEGDDETKFIRRGTFKVNKSKQRVGVSTIVKAKDINERQQVQQETQKKLRDLSINIKMKEELIRELVANSKFTNKMNTQYQLRIESLEKEVNKYKAEIAESQRHLVGKDLEKIEIELKKQLDTARQKIADLESSRGKESKFLNSTTATTTTTTTTAGGDKRVNELELALGKMRQQNDILQKRVKEESEKKLKLEKDLEKEQQKLKDLETKSEQQQKILKKKSEDLVLAQRRLRSGSSNGLNQQANGAITPTADSDSKHWLEQEMEKIMVEKRNVEMLREEIKKLKELVAKKEILLKEREELQVKKLRSSQSVNLSQIDQRLESVNKQIEDSSSGIFAVSVKELEETHGSLMRQRKQLDERMGKGGALNALEERRIIEIDEAIEALEIAIDYENDSIKEQQNRLKDSVLLNTEVSDSVLDKLSTIPYDETKHLVRKFFQKIIDLKESEQKKHLETSELQIQIDAQNRLVDQLRQALSSASNDLERRLVEQKTRSEKNVKLLTQELTECNVKILKMEKEISFYKEKLSKLKSSTKSGSHMELELESSSIISNPAHQASGSFFVHGFPQSDANNLESNSDVLGSARTVKVSRKDLRRLTEDELLKRSVKKS